MPSSWLKVRSRGLSTVWKRYEEPWSPTVAALADPARATAPTVSSPDATVAAATRRAFFLTDMMVSPFSVVRAICWWCGRQSGNALALGVSLGDRGIHGAAGPGGALRADARPQSGCADQIPAQSSGRKFTVGWPLARMLALVPWCRFRYQPAAGTGMVTPVTVRTWPLTWPRALAMKCLRLYWTGPWLAQLPTWMCAACAPGVRPLAVSVTVMVRACGS